MGAGQFGQKTRFPHGTVGLNEEVRPYLLQPQGVQGMSVGPIASWSPVIVKVQNRVGILGFDSSGQMVKEVS